MAVKSFIVPKAPGECLSGECHSAECHSAECYSTIKMVETLKVFFGLILISCRKIFKSPLLKKREGKREEERKRDKEKSEENKLFFLLKLEIYRSNDIGDLGAIKLGEVVSNLLNLSGLNLNFK